MAQIKDIMTRSDQYQLLETAKRNRQKRHRLGYFLIEGVKAVNLALSTGWPIVGVVYARERALSAWAQEVISRIPAHYRLSPELMAELSDREETSELIALGAIRNFDLTQVPLPRRLVVLLDRPISPGNLGSVIRSCDAMGADALVVCGHSADVYDPQCVRASIGTLFTLPVCRIQGPKELETLRQRMPGVRFVGTSAHAQAPLFDLDLSGPTLLLMGNETEGLSKGLKEICDEMALIPISGNASSLNLASAASICLYEVERQRYGVHCV